MQDCGGEKACHLIESIKRDLDSKHQQNRHDIHALRDGQQIVVDKLYEVEKRVFPLVDNGQPGLVTRLAERIEELVGGLSEDVKQVTSSVDRIKGQSDAIKWLLSVVISLLGIMVAYFAYIDQHHKNSWFHVDQQSIIVASEANRRNVN